MVCHLLFKQLGHVADVCVCVCTHKCHGALKGMLWLVIRAMAVSREGLEAGLSVSQPDWQVITHSDKECLSLWNAP